MVLNSGLSAITTLNSNISQKLDTSKIVSTYLNFNSDGNLVVPSDVKGVKGNGQLVITVRNTSNGNISTHWYDSSAKVFRYVSGTKSTNGQGFVQYITD